MKNTKTNAKIVLKRIHALQIIAGSIITISIITALGIAEGLDTGNIRIERAMVSILLTLLTIGFTTTFIKILNEKKEDAEIKLAEHNANEKITVTVYKNNGHLISKYYNTQ